MTSQTMLTEATEDELGMAVHENLYALFRSMQALPGCEVVESDREGKVDELWRSMSKYMIPDTSETRAPEAARSAARPAADASR